MLSGSCHCGAVSLEINRKPRQLTECNCSICRRYGALWAYYTRKTVRITCSTPESLSAYMWGNKSIEFYHCAKCGCVVFYERSKKIGEKTTVAVNARMLRPQEIAHVRIRKLDGASTWRFLD